MSSHFLELLAVSCIVITLAAASLSLFRAIMAVRAKLRFRDLLNSRLGQDAELRKLSDSVADHPLSKAEVDRALQQMEANLTLLSTTDRLLLEPGLNRNTRTGAIRFVKEILAKA